MAADVDQPAGRWHGGRIRRVQNGRVAASDSRERKDREHQVELDAAAATAHVPARLVQHPDHQQKQRGWPDPAEGLTCRGAEGHEHEPADAHEHRRRHRPPLRVIGEPQRQQPQQRPARRESAQDCAREDAFLDRDEREGDKEERPQRTPWPGRGPRSNPGAPRRQAHLPCSAPHGWAVVPAGAPAAWGWEGPCRSSRCPDGALSARTGGGAGWLRFAPLAPRRAESGAVAVVGVCTSGPGPNLLIGGDRAGHVVHFPCHRCGRGTSTVSG